MILSFHYKKYLKWDIIKKCVSTFLIAEYLIMCISIIPLFYICILILRIGLRLVDLNNYLDIAYRFKISRPK